MHQPTSKRQQDGVMASPSWHLGEAITRKSWRVERETGLEPATPCLEGAVSLRGV